MSAGVRLELLGGAASCSDTSDEDDLRHYQDLNDLKFFSYVSRAQTRTFDDEHIFRHIPQPGRTTPLRATDMSVELLHSEGYCADLELEYALSKSELRGIRPHLEKLFADGYAVRARDWIWYKDIDLFSFVLKRIEDRNASEAELASLDWLDAAMAEADVATTMP